MYTDITLWPNQVCIAVESAEELAKLDTTNYVDGVTCLVKDIYKLYVYLKNSNEPIGYEIFDGITSPAISPGVVTPNNKIGQWVFLQQDYVSTHLRSPNLTLYNLNMNEMAICHTEGPIVGGATITLILPHLNNFIVDGICNKVRVINQLLGSGDQIIIKPYDYSVENIVSGTVATTNTINSAVTCGQTGATLEFTNILDNTWFLSVIPQFQGTSSSAVTFS